MDWLAKYDWIDALRSGEYKQTTGKLRRVEKDKWSGSPEGYCCLGVLADVLGCEFGKTDNYDGSTPVKGPQGGHGSGLLPMDILNSVCLPDRLQQQLAMQNDNGKSFAEIADWIQDEVRAEMCEPVDVPVLEP